jgi:preprotein translocase subunit SecD
MQWRTAAMSATLVTLIAGCSQPAPSVVPPVATTRVELSVLTRDKPSVEAAMDVLSARLRHLGIGNFSASAGDSVVYELPSAGLPTARVLDDVLHVTGEFSFLAWPDGRQPPATGDAVPAGIRSLVSPSGIASAAVFEADDATRGVRIGLAREAATAIQAFTAAHVGSYMPVALDGRILTAPLIQGPIDGGSVLLQLLPDGPIEPAALAAILDSGPLPEGVIGR